MRQAMIFGMAIGAAGALVAVVNCGGIAAMVDGGPMDAATVDALAHADAQLAPAVELACDKIHTRVNVDNFDMSQHIVRTYYAQSPAPVDPTTAPSFRAMLCDRTCVGTSCYDPGAYCQSGFTCTDNGDLDPSLVAIARCRDATTGGGDTDSLPTIVEPGGDVDIVCGRTTETRDAFGTTTAPEYGWKYQHAYFRAE